MMNEIKVNADTAEFVSFIAAVQVMYDEYMKQYTSFPFDTKIEFEVGPRYIRVVKREYVKGETKSRGGSVHTFIDRTNGDIHKAGGWKSPAKNGRRSNIFNDDNGLGAVNHHGAIYLR